MKTKTPPAKKSAATKTPAPKPSLRGHSAAKPRRLEDIARGRAGCFPITPTLIQAEPGFNSRLELGDLQALATDIEANGLQQPLKIRKENGSENIWLIDGHRRHTAITTILIPQDRWPRDKDDPSLPAPVECTSEKRGTKPIDRLFMQLSMNTGKAFTFLEEATLFKRILAADSTLTGAEIARRTGKTKQAISDSLRLVNDGCAILLDHVQQGTLAATTALAIIKLAGPDPTAQDDLYQQAAQNAEQAGRPGHIMPKDIPGHATKKDEPTPPDDSLWTSKTTGDPCWNEHSVATNPSTLTAKLCKGIETLEITTAFHEPTKTWHSGYEYGFKSGSCAGGGSGPSHGHHSFPDEPAAIRHAWDILCTRLLEGSRSHPNQPAILKHATLLGHDLSATYPTGTPWDESALIPAPKSTTPDPDDEDEDDEETEDPTFTLYIIDEPPTEPISEDESTYHETDRLVLQNLPSGIERLHLLCAATQEGVCYGYRINDTEYLPNTQFAGTFDLAPEQGYRIALESALKAADFASIDSANLIDQALYDALCRYLPEQGTPEEPEHLPFVAVLETPAAETSGYEAIKAAPSGGGNGGGGGSTYLDPQTFKAVEKIEKILEDLADKNTGVEDRVTAVDIALGVLRNERPPSDLRNHLLGK